MTQLASSCDFCDLALAVASTDVSPGSAMLVCRYRQNGGIFSQKAEMPW